MKHPSASILRTIPFTLLVLSTAVTANAQSLVEQDLLAPIGSAWHMRALQTVPEEQIPIEPIVWAYTSAVGNDLFGATYTIMDPAEVAGSGAFPATDRVVRKVSDFDPQNITYTFQDVQSGIVLDLGSYGPVLNTNYRAPGLAFAYPLEHGASVSDWFCYSTSSISGTVDYCGTTTITLDAIGTLQLPFGTFADVHRVTTRRAIIPVPVEEGVDSTILTINEWYVAGTPFPLLQFSKLQSPDGSVTRTGQVIDENSLVGILETRRQQRLEAFPNPTAGIVNVTTNTSDERAELIALDGRMVRQLGLNAVDGQRTIDLSDVPDGVYHLSIWDDVSVRSTKVVVAH
ncbi:MAG: T9SS type A sorting domain-containing protein [Flavobacteriales bacterium]